MWSSDKVITYSALDLVDLEIPDGHFLIGPRVLPKGGRMVLGGLTGIGKTFVVLNLVRSLVEGGYLFESPEWKCVPSKVLLIDKELDPWTLGERIGPIFQDLPRDLVQDNFKVISDPPSFYLSNQSCVEWLGDYCERESIDVLILDPINQMHFWGENDASEGLRLIEALRSIQRGKVSVVFTHHFKKPLQGRDAENYDPLSMYNFRGTARLIEDSSMVLTLDRQPGNLNNDGHESWALECLVAKLRHGGRPANPNFRLHVNESDDRRVLWQGNGKESRRPRKNIPVGFEAFPG